jgi:hypothetical protein
MQTFTPSPKVPAGHDTLQVEALHTGEVPGSEDPSHVSPQLPQWLTLLVRSTQLVVPPDVQGLVAELVRAAQVPSARPVVADEHAWHDRPQALSQHTPSRHDLELHSAAALQETPFSFSGLQLPLPQ